MDFTASSTPTGTGPTSASASAYGHDYEYGYDTYTRRDGGRGEEQELSGTEGDAVRFADTSLQWGPDLSAYMGKYSGTGADDADTSWDVPTPAFSGTDIASPSASASFPTSASASFSASDQGFRAAPTVTGPPYVPEFQGAYLSAQSSRSNQATRGSQSWQSGQSSQSLSQSQSVSMSSADWRAAPVPLYSRLPLHQPQSQPQSQPRSQSHARTGEAGGAGGGAGAAEANALYSNIRGERGERGERERGGREG
ncbi:hypothetical protein B484DRAFT_211779 [Ochromonadaceae sp. CCMP2298]|nr:hypothetical protein B484DRAFT_211779 [Ochromonadaceae sp. CCMP2298]